jgi:hypothetical protein
MGLQPRHFQRLGVDGVDPALEATSEDVLEQPMTDRVGPAAGADHSDRRGEQHGVHADGLGAVLSRLPNRQ